MEYMSGDMVRWSFGFANPNHAAAAICALFPLCWGWRGKWRWAGRLVGAALCAMLAMTFSRTGMLVLLCETIALWRTASRQAQDKALPLPRCRVILMSVVALAVGTWWMWPRLSLDGAVVNRPTIWLAGLRLFAANPLGVGFGNSGEITTAFLLPEGIAVRTLVNSHLTLLAEAGALAGGAWLAFIALALSLGQCARRGWVSFAGLVLSAATSSVFDWHVLFDFSEHGGLGTTNFVLAWVLLAGFAATGTAMAWAGAGNIPARRCLMARTLLPPFGIALVLCIAIEAFSSKTTPKVDGGFAIVGDGSAIVFRDQSWSMRSVRGFFPGGARFHIATGVPEDVPIQGEVWLFGDVAESAWRFPAARVTLVSPPEFCETTSSNIVQTILGWEALK